MDVRGADTRARRSLRGYVSVPVSWHCECRSGSWLGREGWHGCNGAVLCRCFDPSSVGFGLASDIACTAQCVGECAVKLGNFAQLPALWASGVGPGWLSKFVVIAVGWVICKAWQDCGDKAGIRGLPWSCARWPGAAEVEDGLKCIVCFSDPDRAEDTVHDLRPACPQRSVQRAEVVPTAGELDPR